MAPEQRDPIIKELQIPPNVTKCCSACLTRIKRQMGTRLSLSDEEIQKFRKQLQEVGPKWSQLAEQLNKSATVLKTFYFHNKKKYGFDQAVNEYFKTHANEGPRPITDDGDESDVSVTSSDENGPESVKSEFPSNVDGEKVEVKNEPMVTTIVSTTPVTSISSVSMQIPANKEIIAVKSEMQTPQIDERLPPPLGQPPPLLSSQQIQNLNVTGLSRAAENHPLVSVMMRTKKHSEEYDSSATETADEENESSPANRQSPKASVFAGKNLNPATTISMVPTLPAQNGPLSSVHDVVLNVIERTLKNPSAPPKHSGVPPLKPNPPSSQAPIDNNPEVTFVGTYRHDPNKIQIQPQRRGNSDGLQSLATLSIVNSHGPNVGPNSQMIGGHPLNISSIAATITPVPPPQMNQPPRSTLPPQHMTQAQEKDMKFGIRAGLNQSSTNMSQSEPEPQTLDLSIKKPAQQQQQQQPERSFPSFAKAPPPPTGGSIYRGDPNIPSQTYLAFHQEVNRPSKSPSTHIPPPLSPNQRVLNLPPHAVQSQQGMQQNKSKVAQKLSPKVHHQIPVSQSPGSQQMNGPKGSITLGTPLNDRGQPIMIQGGPPGSRYDILRQTPPSADNKFGSITAGTPIHLSDKRVHEYMKNSRHSPATSQPNVSSAPSGSPHPSMAAYRNPNELSSTRDLIFSDYMISQQMQGQSRGGPNIPNTINIISAGPQIVQQGRSEKESPSPRNIAHSSSPASMYYGDKERERVGGQTRTEYLSRSSPADHHNR